MIDLYTAAIANGHEVPAALEELRRVCRMPAQQLRTAQSTLIR